jgi:hypothetical protein
MRKRHIIAIFVPLMLVLGVVVGRSRAAIEPASQSSSEARPIDAPTEWVAFSADFVKGQPGMPEVVGRYFRSSTGSDRLESGTPQELDRTVFIRNIAQSLYYSKRKDLDGKTFWLVGTMKLPPGGWKPKQVAENDSTRVMLSQEVEGRQVVQVTSRDFVALMAPSLNFHTLVKRKISTGYYEIYRNVTIVEPSSDLFEPPSGVELRRTETVAGIEVIVPPAK